MQAEKNGVKRNIGEDQIAEYAQRGYKLIDPKPQREPKKELKAKPKQDTETEVKEKQSRKEPEEDKMEAD